MTSQASLNHIFRTVWNQALGAMVAVAETASTCCGGSSDAGSSAAPGFSSTNTRFATLALGISLAWGALTPNALANPVGGIAIQGQATFNTNQPNQLLVTTQNGAGTNHSAISWQSFSIAAGETTRFQQPNATSLVINRVVTNTPSALFGTLSSNGSVVLVNQAGIAVGAGAVVDTAGFTASTLGMSESDAISGRLRFGSGELGNFNGGALTVQGNLIARGGDVVLIAPNVELAQSAVVEAKDGAVLLAAGRNVEITGRGLEGITLQVQAPTDQALNLGSLSGDAVGIFAGTLRHSGVIQATTAILEGGRVVLKASEDAYVEGHGKIIASGAVGGSVDVLGNRVALTQQAQIDASGDHGGGKVRIGGDLLGQNPSIQNATVTYVGAGTEIKADATDTGNGGTVVVWSDNATRFAGSVSARGGALAGDGGLAEVSGKQYLDFRGSADLTAPSGRAGSLLLDPASLTIGSVANLDGMPPTGDDATGDILSSDYAGMNSEISASAVSSLLNTANLSLSATGDVTVSSPITKTSGGTTTTLSLSSTSGNINLNAPIGYTAGNPLRLTLNAMNSITQGVGAAMTVTTLTATTTGNYSSITLNEPNQVTSAGFSAGPVGYRGDVSFSDSGSVLYLDSVSAGSFTLSTQGNIYSYSPISASGAVDVRTSNGFANFCWDDCGAIDAGGTIRLEASGDLTIGNLTSSASASDNAVTLISTEGILDASNYGSTITTPNGRWLAYLTDFYDCDCSNNQFGDLTASFKQYGAPSGTLALGSGNGVLYANAVYLGGELSGPISKTYDGNSNISLSGASFASVRGGPAVQTSNGDNLGSAALVSGSGTLDNKNFGSGKTVTAQQVVVSGVSGPEGDDLTVYGYAFNSDYVLSGDIGTVEKATLTLSTLDVSKPYDGGLNALGTAVVNSGTLFNGDTLSGGSFAFTDKNVGLGNKTVTVAGVTVGDGANTTNYNVSYAANTTSSITAAALTLSTADVSKVYDGTLTALGTATVASGTLFNGDTLSGGSFAFTDKNVGQGNKTVTVASVTVGDGANTTNYNVSYAANTTSTITQRPLSTWSGAGGNNLWSNPANWDALPVGVNVAAVSIPAGAVVFDTTVGAITLDHLNSSGALAMSSGALEINTSLSAVSFAQSGGTLSGNGQFTVNGNFNQSGGSITMNRIDITQASGGLSFSNLSSPLVFLTALDSAITQTGSLVANTLITNSVTGTVLDNAGNRIASWQAANTGVGPIELTNVGVLDVQGITNSGGDITLIDTGGVFTSGAISAPAGEINITTNSPLTIGSPGISSGGNIVLTATNLTSAGNMLLDGPISTSGGSITLTAANNLTQNSALFGLYGVTVNVGGTLSFGPYATSGNPTVSYSAGTIIGNLPPITINGTVVYLPEITDSDALMSFMDDFQTLQDTGTEQSQMLIGEITDNYLRPRIKDLIVTEGEICRP